VPISNIFLGRLRQQFPRIVAILKVLAPAVSTELKGRNQLFDAPRVEVEGEKQMKEKMRRDKFCRASSHIVKCMCLKHKLSRGVRKQFFDRFTWSAHTFTKYGPARWTWLLKRVPMELVVLALASNERYISGLLLTVKAPNKDMSELTRPSK